MLSPSQQPPHSRDTYHTQLIHLYHILNTHLYYIIYHLQRDLDFFSSVLSPHTHTHNSHATPRPPICSTFPYVISCIMFHILILFVHLLKTQPHVFQMLAQYQTYRTTPSIPLPRSKSMAIMSVDEIKLVSICILFSCCFFFC